MNKKLILKILKKIFKEYSHVKNFERYGNRIIIELTPYIGSYNDYLDIFRKIRRIK